MYGLLMLLIYVVITASLLAMLIGRLGSLKYISTYISGLGRRIRLRASRLVFILKVLRVVLTKPLVLVAVLAIVIFMIIAAKASAPTYVWNMISKSGGEGDYVLISLNKPLETEYLLNLTSILKAELERGGIKVMDESLILRLTLTKPLVVGNRTIYIVIGLPNKVFSELIRKYRLPRSTTYITSCISDTSKYCLRPNIILNLRLVDNIYLLPVQGYLGLKPILPPPRSTLITTLTQACKLVSINPCVVTDALIHLKDSKGVGRVTSIVTNFINTYLSNYVREVILVSRYGTYAYSKIPIPTPKSLVVALIASTVSIIALLTIFHSVTPEIRGLYNKLLLIGMPQWSMSIITSTYISVLMLIAGIPTLIYTYASYGGIQTFNSFITLAMAWIASLTYLNVVLKPRSLVRSDVYTPVTRRYDLVLSNAIDVTALERVIRESITTNEFFTLEEYESKVYGGEAIIHSRLLYNEVWGSGLDLNIILSSNSEGTRVHILSYLWGVEEVSESVLNTMLSLAISRIVGYIKVFT